MENILTRITQNAGIIKQQSVHLLFSFGPKLIGSIFVLIIGRKIIGRLNKIVEQAFLKTTIDPTVEKFLEGLIKVLLKVILFISIAGMLGVQTTSFIALLGAAGLAVGLALQGSLGNFASGILILLFKPYQIGDFIETGGVMGSVDKIDLLFTTLITPDRKTASIPNSEVTSTAILNYTKQGTRRFDIPVGIGYGENIEEAKRVLLEIMVNSDLVLASPEPTVFVSGLNASSVDLILRGYCVSSNYLTAMSTLTQETKKVLDDNNIEIPFPQTVIHSKTD